MIGSITGIVTRKTNDRVFIDVGGLGYEIYIPHALSSRLDEAINKEITMVTYYYLHMDQSRATPVMIGFLDELEREFFQVFITVSGIGPKAALKAFDQPITLIARAIEAADVGFLTSLSGIGKQKAKQVIAQLQGKVGRFALLKDSGQEEAAADTAENKEVIQEARAVLKRLQYSNREIDAMIKKALSSAKDIASVEMFLNEVYRNIR